MCFWTICNGRKRLKFNFYCERYVDVLSISMEINYFSQSSTTLWRWFSYEIFTLNGIKTLSNKWFLYVKFNGDCWYILTWNNSEISMRLLRKIPLQFWAKIQKMNRCFVFRHQVRIYTMHKGYIRSTLLVYACSFFLQGNITHLCKSQNSITINSRTVGLLNDFPVILENYILPKS